MNGKENGTAKRAYRSSAIERKKLKHLAGKWFLTRPVGIGISNKNTIPNQPIHTNYIVQTNKQTMFHIWIGIHWYNRATVEYIYYVYVMNKFVTLPFNQMPKFHKQARKNHFESILCIERVYWMKNENIHSDTGGKCLKWISIRFDSIRSQLWQEMLISFVRLFMWVCIWANKCVHLYVWPKKELNPYKPSN